MTEPLAVDAAMERLTDAITRWEPTAPAILATNTRTEHGLFRRDIEQLLAEVHRLRATAGHSS
jgi:hypothetical protein